MFMSASKLSHYPASTSNTPVAGYQAWYNPTTIQQTAGVVTAWNDGSANAFNISTAHALPTYNSTAINGLPGVQLNGTSQYLSGTPTLGNLISKTAYTIYCVYQIAAYTGTNNTGGGGNASVFCDSGGFCLQGAGSTHLIALENDGSSKVVDAGAIGTGITVITEQFYDGTNLNFRVNGTNQTPTASTGVSTTTGTMHIGANSTPSQFFEGYICELIFYNTTLSAGNMTSNRSYLGTKYAGTG